MPFSRLDTTLTLTTSSPSTSFTLVQRVRALDGDAWRTLSRLYGPLVYRWARQCRLQPQDASDVTQNVFISILRGIQRFSLDEPQATFRGWLWTITRNAVREFVRRQSQHPQSIGASEMEQTIRQLPDSLDSEDEPNVEGLQVALTHRALDIVRETVEAHNWDAFWRTTALSESAVDVAQSLDMTATAVRQAKYRILCRLRDLLADN